MLKPFNKFRSYLAGMLLKSSGTFCQNDGVSDTPVEWEIWGSNFQLKHAIVFELQKEIICDSAGGIFRILFKLPCCDAGLM